MMRKREERERNREEREKEVERGVLLIWITYSSFFFMLLPDFNSVFIHSLIKPG